MTRMTVNGEPLHYKLDPDTPLLWALRDASNLTGAKHGCDSGECGACTVLVDGRATASCQVAISALEGAEVTTIEGLGPHPLKAAFAAADASLCGFCQPGMIMALAGLLKLTPRPAEADLAALPNLCRCGAGLRIRAALARAVAANPSATAVARAPHSPSRQDESATSHPTN